MRKNTCIVYKFSRRCSIQFMAYNVRVLLIVRQNVVYSICMRSRIIYDYIYKGYACIPQCITWSHQQPSAAAAGRHLLPFWCWISIARLVFRMYNNKLCPAHYANQDECCCYYYYYYYSIYCAMHTQCINLYGSADWARIRKPPDRAVRSNIIQNRSS